jgi:hypothetical protein
MILLIFFLFVCAASAQDMSSMGFVYGPRSPSPTADEIMQQAAREKAAYENRAIMNYPFRWVGTNVWDVRGGGWTTVPSQDEQVKVKEVFGDLVVFEILLSGNGGWDQEKYIVVTNYPDSNRLLTGQICGPMRLMEIGRVNSFGETTAFYDFGKPYIRPPPKPLTPEEIAQQKAMAIANKNAAEARILANNEKEAAQGDVYGLLRMGERYRDGDGVETNPVKARDYLERAAEAGDLTASNELAALPK